MLAGTAWANPATHTSSGWSLARALVDENGTEASPGFFDLDGFLSVSPLVSIRTGGDPGTDGLRIQVGTVQRTELFSGVSNGGREPPPKCLLRDS